MNIFHPIGAVIALIAFVAQISLSLIFPTTSLAAQPNLIGFKKGINLDGWFVGGSTGTASHLDWYYGKNDFIHIKSLGFDHVRLPINPSVISDLNTGTFNTNIVYVDNALKNITSAGLNVVYDIHPDTQSKQDISTNPTLENGLNQLWKNITNRYRKTYTTRQLMYELFNEPKFDTQTKWTEFYTRLMNTVNSIAPSYSYIIDFNLTHQGKGDPILALQNTLPLKGFTNDVYTYHFYDAFLFTHQGATWGWSTLKQVKGVPYPYDANLCNATISATTDATAKTEVTKYCAAKYDRAKLQSGFMNHVVNWKKTHNKDLVINEFGALKGASSPTARYAWTRDVREMMEANGIQWTFWEYGKQFGLVTRSNGTITTDTELLRSLGL